MIKHEERMNGVKILLTTVIHDAAKVVPFDMLVSEGVRSEKQMCINWGKGRTAAECTAKGVPASYAQPKAAKVTWLANPFNSKHATGDAVDVYPLVKGQLATTKDNLPMFRQMYEAVMAAAKARGVKVRYGGDFNQNGILGERGESDFVHFELVGN